MAPTKDKWTRRFIITETRRHKNGFTIYKVISMVFLKSSHEEISKISVWKRYNDFKKLHSELSHLHKHAGTKESFPPFPKSKYFGRFEAEVVEERKKYALKFLEFIGRYSYLYSSDIFITFFESSHTDNYTNDCAYSLSSDTSEDDRIVSFNDPMVVDDMQTTFQVLSKTSQDTLTNPCSILSNVICTNKNEFIIYQQKNEACESINLQNGNVKEEQNYKIITLNTQNVIIRNDAHQDKDFDKNNIMLGNVSGIDNLNNNISKHVSVYNKCSVILHGNANVSQSQIDSNQYLLIAAAHISAAFKHESIAEYEEAFIQYKLGISCLINGVQFDSNSTRITGVKDKISRYLARAEELYNKHLNCNISIINKPVSELQYYKVLKIIKSVMLVMDIRSNCKRIIKTVEKSCIYENNICDCVLRNQVPYMVHLYACIETETAIFLVLQYASCGRLWDFVRLHYRTSDSLCNVILNHTYENTNREINKNNNIENICRPNRVNIVKEDDKVQKKQIVKDLQKENPTEIPTIQLLEKSQELLESVNATLRKSNSIANRLNEYKELKHSKNTSSLDTKTVTHIYQESSNLMKINDIFIAENSLKVCLKNEDLKEDNIVLTKNNKNPNVLRNICTLNENVSHSLKSNKMDNLLCNNFTSKISMQNVSTNSIAHENNNTESISNQINITSIADKTLHIENNIDEKQEFWQVPESVIRSWAAEILLALEALHQQNILILNFKPDNILLNDAGHIRLTYIIPQHNFELSKLMYPYSSPELVMFSPTVSVTSATDIWSFGIILYELLTGTMFIKQHSKLFNSHSIINIPNRLSESARSLLYGMLKYHPEERLTINTIKCHPFFAGIDWLNMISSQI